MKRKRIASIVISLMLLTTFLPGLVGCDEEMTGEFASLSASYASGVVTAVADRIFSEIFCIENDHEHAEDEHDHTHDAPPLHDHEH